MRNSFLNNYEYFQISIHLMCRFDGLTLCFLAAIMKFQYISCVGSIARYLPKSLPMRISIHLMCRFDSTTTKSCTIFTKTFQYISCVGSIIVAGSVSSVAVTFQYISCVGSIPPTRTVAFRHPYFNTSHVSVR